MICRLFPAHHPLDVDLAAIMPTNNHLSAFGKPESQALQCKEVRLGQNPVDDNENACGVAATKSALKALMKEHACDVSKWDVWAEEEDEELRSMHEEAEMQVGP